MAFWSALLARPTKPLPEARPSLTLFFLLSGAFLLTLVPHAIQFPIWLSLTILAAMICRSFLEAYRLPLPSTTFTTILAVIFVGLIFAQFGTIRGREAGTAFAAGLIAIKFYELRRPRDIALIIFSCFFVVMSALLYSQVLELFIYCLIMMWVLVALLLRVQMGDAAQDRLLSMLRVSGIIFLQAVPLALLLFFCFPRYHGTLGLPLDEGTLGFSDTVAPGSIAKLAQSDAKAMYVKILRGNIPPPESMYWRGLVLWDYKDGAWKVGVRPAQPLQEGSAPPNPDDEVGQEIIILPHNQRWLFALDVPNSQPVNESEEGVWAQLYSGDVLQLGENVKLDHLTRYAITSSMLRTPTRLRRAERMAATALPNLPDDRIDPQVQALADQLHAGLRDDQVEEYVYAVLRYLHHGGFTYSLTPGSDGNGPEWLANFLFRKKLGFCEHFASAFAVLLRAENVPARVVVGYLGAEFNPYDNLYVVTQAHAHAWDEVWIPTKGQPASENLGNWVRFDPTAQIASVDATQAQAANPKPGENSEIQLVQREPGFFERHLPPWAKESLKEFQLRRDQLESNWDNVVLSYDSETQTKLAQAMGMGEKARLGLLGFSLLAMAACLFVLQKWMARKPVVPPVEKLYATFCRNMARRGMPRAMWEGPLAYTERVAEVFPEDKRTIQRFGSIVANARYGPIAADGAAVDNLKSLLTVLSASLAAAGSRDRRENSLPK
jgi:protein-glutamine gamma-glutamyltransferase